MQFSNKKIFKKNKKRRREWRLEGLLEGLLGQIALASYLDGEGLGNVGHGEVDQLGNSEEHVLKERTIRN